jgi:hypothetical protein
VVARILVVASDPVIGARLATALEPLGEVAVREHAADDDAALRVVHGATLGHSVVPAIALLAVAPDPRMRGELAATVEVMRRHDHVLGVLVTRLEPPNDGELATLRTMVARSFAGPPLAIAGLVAPGTAIQHHRAGSYHDKVACLDAAAELARTFNVRRRHRERIERCLDEMLMNALYDAPIDAIGQRLFAGVPRTEVQLPPERGAHVQLACDGGRFALSVRDAYGTLARATMLAYLHKCIHAENQIGGAPGEHQPAGAGLGLYFMASSATELYFRVLPGQATEVACAFELSAVWPRLCGLAFAGA